MKNFLHILFVCSILNWPLQIHAQQQASLPALKSEAVAEVDKMQTMTQQMVDQVLVSRIVRLLANPINPPIQALRPPAPSTEVRINALVSSK
jgi:hypothetical protein